MSRSNPLWLVFGASGYVGRNLVPHLLAQGRHVRAAARQISPLKAEGWMGVDLVQADALDSSSLSNALNGVEVAFYLVHSMGSGRGFPERDRKAAQNFAQAAEVAGVKRIVYLGGLAPKQADTEHLASRVETGEILRAGAVPVIELRAGIIIGAGSAAFEVMRDLTAHLPVMVTPHWISVSSPPIALPDLLNDLIDLAEVAEAEGQVLETGGPERLTYEAMMRRLAKALGRRDPIIIAVPLLTPQLSSYWLDLVTGVPAPIARALIGGLRHDLTADDQSLRALVPRQCLSFDEALTLALDSEKQILAGDRWREGAFDLRGYRHDISFYGKRLTLQRSSCVSLEILWSRLEQLIKRGESFKLWRRYREKVNQGMIVRSSIPSPGKGGLEITLTSDAKGGSSLVLTQHWHPAGVWGLLYWFILWPLRAIALRVLLSHLTRS
ncbi:MAG: NAD-dependent epimerase/dehydratase family protein [Oceanospirillales bacterium]|nr:MAG: NAD-dependent epimerase/dehydratase family protein [Oceanospirillales bacterium]